MYFDAKEGKRNDEVFFKIISCCLPFEIEIAKNSLNKLIKFIDCDEIKIDGDDLFHYDVSKLNQIHQSI